MCSVGILVIRLNVELLKNIRIQASLKLHAFIYLAQVRLKLYKQKIKVFVRACVSACVCDLFSLPLVSDNSASSVLLRD